VSMRLDVGVAGCVDYRRALAWQEALLDRRLRGGADALLLLEHPPVYTLGRRADRRHLGAAADGPVPVVETGRGGEVTYHGPGQLVGYPIIDLKRHTQDLHWYLRQVEEGLIVALGALGIDAERNKGKTGVWTKGRKIASIGVHARDWVTWHGFALNVNTDLSYFDMIVPCGITGVEMTSVARELGIPRADAAGARAEVVRAFGSVFGLAARVVARESLPLLAPH